MKASTGSWDQQSIEEALQIKGPILITGGSGFIGANLFRSLSALRDDVWALCRDAKSPGWRLADVSDQLRSKLLSADLNDEPAILRICQQLKPQTIFHLATYGGYPDQKDPQKTLTTNVIALAQLIYALADQGISSFVHAGTSSEYGFNSAAPRESARLEPNTIYGVSKASAALTLESLAKHFRFPAVNLRLYSIYGEWEAEDRLLPRLIRFGLEGNLPPLGDPLSTRDYVYIHDCTAAFVRAAARASRFESGISMNIASGCKTSLQEIVEVARETLKLKAQPVFQVQNARAYDSRDWYGDARLAQELLGWKAKRNLQEGFQAQLAWYRAYHSSVRS